MRIAISTAIFGATLIAASLAPSVGFAHSAYAPGAEPKHSLPPQLGSSNLHRLAGSVVDFGNLDTVEQTGYSLIDSNTVVCSKASCTIAVDMQEQVGNATTTSNWFAVCAQIDGSFGPYGCPYAGEVPSDTSYVGNRARQTFPSVSKGTHTVAVYLFLSAGPANSDAYDIEYNVLTP